MCYFSSLINHLQIINMLDYNKPYFWNDRYLDNTKVIAEEWFLKPQFTSVRTRNYDKASGHFNNDLAKNNRSVVVIGTELQNLRKFEEMLKTYGWQQQDCWDIDLKPEYLKHYKENNNLPTLINLI